MPDLLFEDERDARVGEIAAYLDAPEHVTGRDPLHRITVFLTYRCNLDCLYCKTIARTEEELAARPQKRASFTASDFARLLESHGDTPVRHLHFTGGEATLVPGMADMVRLARTRGVERISVTSNGTLPPGAYLDLIDAGLDEIRVSLDAADPLLGKRLTQRGGAFRAAVRTLRALSRERAGWPGGAARIEQAQPPSPGGRRFFLIINTVVGLENHAQLPEILAFLLSLGPDDIKLITAVDEKDRLAKLPGAAALVARMLDLLAPYPEEAFPLLRRKLRTVFAPDAIGLAGVAAPPGRKWRCYVPLTERTVDALHYYPCSVYLRENGVPLGRVDEPQALQREKTAAFVRDADCLRDPICATYCLHCTREYNARANEARR